MSDIVQGMVSFALMLASFLFGLGAGLFVGKRKRYTVLQKWIAEKACWVCQQKFEGEGAGEQEEDEE